MKYLQVCANSEVKAMTLYRANIRLSQQLFAVLGIFEVALRNAIDVHYCNVFGSDWIRKSVESKGFLDSEKCARSKQAVLTAVRRLGAIYRHERGWRS